MSSVINTSINDETKEINERLLFVRDFLLLLEETRVFGSLLDEALDDVKIAMKEVASLGSCISRAATDVAGREMLYMEKMPNLKCE